MLIRYSIFKILIGFYVIIEKKNVFIVQPIKNLLLDIFIHYYIYTVYV